MADGKSVTNAFNEFIICVTSIRDNGSSQLVVETVRGQEKGAVITQHPVVEEVLHRNQTLRTVKFLDESWVTLNDCIAAIPGAYRQLIDARCVHHQCLVLRLEKKDCVAAFRSAGVAFKMNVQKGVLVRLGDFRDKLDVEKQWSKVESSAKTLSKLASSLATLPSAAAQPGAATAAATTMALAPATAAAAAATATLLSQQDDPIGHATDGDVYHCAAKVCLTLDEVMRVRALALPRSNTRDCRTPQVPRALNTAAVQLACAGRGPTSPQDLQQMYAHAVMRACGSARCDTFGRIASQPHGGGPPPKRVRTTTPPSAAAASAPAVETVAPHEHATAAAPQQNLCTAIAATTATAAAAARAAPRLRGSDRQCGRCNGSRCHGLGCGAICPGRGAAGLCGCCGAGGARRRRQCVERAAAGPGLYRQRRQRWRQWWRECRQQRLWYWSCARCASAAACTI